MKKFIILVTVVLFSFSIFACKPKSEPKISDGSGPAPAAAALDEVQGWAITNVEKSGMEYSVTLNNKLKISGIAIEMGEVVLPYRTSSGGRKYEHLEAANMDGEKLLENIKRAVVNFESGQFTPQTGADDISFSRLDVRLWSSDDNRPPLGFGNLVLNNSLKVNNFVVGTNRARTNLEVGWATGNDRSVHIVCLDNALNQKIAAAFEQVYLSKNGMDKASFLAKWGSSSSGDADSSEPAGSVYISDIQKEGNNYHVELFDKIVVKDFEVSGGMVILPGYTNTKGRTYNNIEAPFKKSEAALDKIKTAVSSFASSGSFEKGAPAAARITDVFVNVPKSLSGSLKGFAKVTFNDAFTISNYSIREGKDGLWIAWPSKRDGGKFIDQVEIKDDTLKKEIESRIFQEYKSKGGEGKISSGGSDF